MTTEPLEPQNTSPTPPSPWPITRLLHLATQGGVEIMEQEAAAIKAIRVQEEEPQNAPIPDSPIYSPTSPTPEASRPATPDLTYPGPDPVHHSQINIGPDTPAWPWMERRHYPSMASVPYRLADHEEPQLLDYVRLTLDSITGQPTTVSTTGIGQPQYATHLFAQPIPKNPSDPIAEDLWSESPLGGTMAFDPVFNRAIWELRDAGVWADVLHLHAEDARGPEFRAWDDRVKKLEEFALAERRAYCAAKDQSWTKRSGASNRLLAARATTRILRIVQGIEDPNDFERRMRHLHEEGWMPVRVRAGQGPSTFPRSRTYVKPTCTLCHFKGHTATDCEDPHLKCSAKRSGYCWINP